MSRVRMRFSITSLFFSFIMLGCSGAPTKQADNLATRLRVGMPIQEVQEIAKEANGFPLKTKNVDVATLLHHCANKECVPKDLHKHLRYVSDFDNKKIVHLDEIDLIDRGIQRDHGFTGSTYHVYEQSVGMSWLSLGSVPIDIAIFYDSDTKRVIGWMAHID